MHREIYARVRLVPHVVWAAFRQRTGSRAGSKAAGDPQTRAYDRMCLNSSAATTSLKLTLYPTGVETWPLMATSLQLSDLISIDFAAMRACILGLLLLLSASFPSHPCLGAEKDEPSSGTGYYAGYRP